MATLRVNTLVLAGSYNTSKLETYLLDNCCKAWSREALTKKEAQTIATQIYCHFQDKKKRQMPRISENDVAQYIAEEACRLSYK